MSMEYCYHCRRMQETVMVQNATITQWFCAVRNALVDDLYADDDDTNLEVHDDPH